MRLAMASTPSLDSRARLLAVPFGIPPDPLALIGPLLVRILERHRYRPKYGPPRTESLSPSYESSSRPSRS